MVFDDFSGIAVDQFTQIGLRLETKLEDDPSPIKQTGWTFSSMIIQPFSDKFISA